MDRGRQATSDCGGDGHGDAETHEPHLHMRREVKREQGGHTVRSELWRKLAERGCGGRRPSLKHAMIQAVGGWRVPGKDCSDARVQRVSVQRGTTERWKPLPLELASQILHALASAQNRHQTGNQETLRPSWRESVVSSKGYSYSTSVLLERQSRVRIGEIPWQSGPLLEGEQKRVLELVGTATEI